MTYSVLKVPLNPKQPTNVCGLCVVVCVCDGLSVCGLVGRLAAVWPLVGIVLEAVVLCVIIVVHERRRAHQRALAAATESPDNDKDVVVTANRLQVTRSAHSLSLSLNMIE